MHVNKGFAGAPEHAIAAAHDTAINPVALDAFALLICGAGEPPAYPGVAGHQPNVAAGRQQALAVDQTMTELRQLVH